VGKIKTVGVIGGGVSGLAAGGLLSREGVKVKLFEASDKLGGCCANTILGGYTFNDGAGYLCLPGILDHVFEKLGLDRPSILPLRKVKAHQTILPNGTVVLLGGKSKLKVNQRLGEVDTVRLQKELRKLLNKWESVLRLYEDDLFVHPFLLSRLITKIWPHIHKLQGTVASELRKLFSDKAVQAAIAGSLLFITGAPPQKTPVPMILSPVAILTEGFYLPEGGMGKIPEALSQSLRKNGGELFLNSKVNRILLKNGIVHGLEIDGLGLIELDAVVSTVSGMVTFGSLLKPEDLPHGMRQKVKKVPLSHKALSIQLGLSNVLDGCSHSNSVLPMMNEQSTFFMFKEDEVKWFTYLVPTVTMPELAPRIGSIIEMFPAIRQDRPADDWDEQKTGRVVESGLQALSGRHKINIAVKRVLSPKDFQNKMRLYKGAIYGLSGTADFRAQFPHAPGVPGLYQAGQTTYPGFGVGPAAMSGIFAAEALLRTKKYVNIISP
jgi:phytoene dehydrogenase-like protein